MEGQERGKGSALASTNCCLRARGDRDLSISNGMMEKMTSTICTGGTLIAYSLLYSAIEFTFNVIYIVVWSCDSH